MKKNRMYIIIGGAIALLLIGGTYFILSAKHTVKPVQQVSMEDTVVPAISPDALGVKLLVREDKQAVKFEIANIKGITAVEYQIQYKAKGPDGQDLDRGAIGTINVTPDMSRITPEKYIDLGTCSSGTCKYDKGVTLVKFIFSITKDDGKTYSSEKTLDLSSQ